MPIKFKFLKSCKYIDFYDYCKLSKLTLSRKDKSCYIFSPRAHQTTTTMD